VANKTIAENVEDKAAWLSIITKGRMGRRVNVHSFDADHKTIVFMGDEHIGSKFYAERDHLENLEWCFEHDVPLILMGDELETATKTSVGAGVFEQEDIVQGQLEKAVKIYKPFADAGLILGNHIGNHECLSSDTEVLTKRGWLSHSEVNSSDKVFSFNCGTELGEWVKIDKIHKFDYVGELFRLKSCRLDFLFTPNHRLIFKSSKSKNWKFKEISEFKNTCTRATLPISVKNTNKEYPISDAEIKIMAWLLTDGWISNKDFCYFSQSGEKHKLITNILKELGWEYTIRKRQRNITHICGRKLKNKPKPEYQISLTKQSSKLLLKLVNNKKEIPDYTEKLSERQVDLFVESYIDGDGSRKKDCLSSMMIYSSNKNQVDVLQGLLVQNGYSCHSDEYCVGAYRLNITKRTTTQLASRGKLFDKHITLVPYDGIVWCLSVPNGNFMIRRMGKICFTGNSRVYKHSGANLSKILAQMLDIPYLGVGAAHIIRVGGQSYTMYTTHGSSGARMPHTKIANVLKMQKMIESEIYAAGHVHQLSHHVQNYYKINKRNKTVEEAQKHYILTGAYLHHWGSYAHVSNMEPARIGSPKLKLSGLEHRIRVSLG